MTEKPLLSRVKPLAEGGTVAWMRPEWRRTEFAERSLHAPGALEDDEGTGRHGELDDAGGQVELFGGKDRSSWLQPGVFPVGGGTAGEGGEAGAGLRISGDQPECECGGDDECGRGGETQQCGAPCKREGCGAWRGLGGFRAHGLGKHRGGGLASASERAASASWLRDVAHSSRPSSMS